MKQRRAYLIVTILIASFAICGCGSTTMVVLPEAAAQEAKFVTTSAILTGTIFVTDMTGITTTGVVTVSDMVTVPLAGD